MAISTAWQVPVRPLMGSPDSSRVYAADDVATVELARQGDLAAFEAIYGAYQPRIAGYLFRMTRDSEVAADLTQDVFIRAYRSIGQTRAELNLRAWLFAIATNLAISHHRRGRLVRWLPLDHSNSEPSVRGPEENAALRTDLAAALATLPPDQAACFLLAAQHGLSYDEVGVAVGISAGAAKTQAYRARLALARVLRPVGENP